MTTICRACVQRVRNIYKVRGVNLTLAAHLCVARDKMDLTQYYWARNNREDTARRQVDWLIGQFRPDERTIRCKITWNDCCMEEMKLIGEVIVGMLYSSGYWASFTQRMNHNKLHVIFKVERMSPGELENTHKAWKEAGFTENWDDSDDEEKIDDPAAPKVGTEQDGRISSQS